MSIFNAKNKIKQINCEEINNSYKVRVYRDVSKLLNLDASIQENGVIEPILVHRIDKKQYEVISGARRLEAVKRLGMLTIPAIVVGELERDAYELTMLLHAFNEPITLFEKSQILSKIVNEKIMSKSKLLDQLGLPETYLDKLLQISEVSPTIKYALNNGQITEAECFFLMSLTEGESEKALNTMVRDIARETYKDVRRLESVRTDRTSLSIAVNTIQNGVDLIAKTGHPFVYDTEETQSEVIYTIKIQK